MVHLEMPESATSEEAVEEVGVRELRDHLSKWLDAVKNGGDVIITERGKPVARIIPITWSDKMARLVAEGVITPAEAPRSDPSTWKKVTFESGASLSDIVIEDRRR